MQVRDALHVDDLYDLIVRQVDGLDEYSGGLFNVGGGMVRSVSLRELISISQKISGRKIDLGQTRDADIPFYVSDYQAVTRATGWTPKRSLDQLLEDVWHWLVDERAQLESILSQ